MVSAHRPLWKIAQEAERDWSQRGKGVSIHARPYLSALKDLESISDRYGADDARTVVLYFLSNSAHWRGPVARELKAELKAML